MIPVVRGIAAGGVTVLMIEHVMQAVMHLARARVGAGAGPADRRGHAGRGDQRRARDRGLPRPRCGGAPAGGVRRDADDRPARRERPARRLRPRGGAARRGPAGARRRDRRAARQQRRRQVHAQQRSSAAWCRPAAAACASTAPTSPTRHYRDIVKAGLIQVPEGRRIFPNLSVRENLELGAFARARERRAANLERVFAIFPRLAERTTQKAGTMSGGEQQMLAIGRGLMAEPRLLILDEPSLGLSPLLVEELFALIQRLHADGPVGAAGGAERGASRWRSRSAPSARERQPAFRRHAGGTAGRRANSSGPTWDCEVEDEAATTLLCSLCAAAPALRARADAARRSACGSARRPAAAPTRSRASWRPRWAACSAAT